MATAIPDMSIKELDSYLDESRREILNLRFNYALARSLQNPANVRHRKKIVARILTEKRKRELLAIASDDNAKLKGKDDKKKIEVKVKQKEKS